MPSILANRPVIEERFPVLGFTVRTGLRPSWFEVALATDPELFHAEAKARRNPNNFYSSHSAGPLPAAQGEAVYLVPADILARFAGQPQLYYVLAVSERPDLGNAQAAMLPPGSVPFISLSKTFTGRTRRMQVAARGIRSSGRGYGDNNPSALTWAGDTSAPGKAEPVPGATISPATPPAHAPKSNGAAHAAELDYDDTFDPRIWGSSLEAGSDGDADEHGIEGPIPDGSAMGLSRGLGTGAPQPEYPQARRFVAAAAGNYSKSASPRTIRRVVIHITDGGRNINGTIGWFQDPSAHVSAHYIVGLDGEVVQMVLENDMAWHASRANGDSIGIEHVANTRGLKPTETEYCASAALVRYLCDKYQLAMDHVDAAHWGPNITGIQGHSEADPKTGHKGCPNAVWDWDYFMSLVTSGSCFPRGQAPVGGAQAYGSALGVAVTQRPRRTVTFEGFDSGWNDVELVPQMTGMSCWAAAAAMVVGWRDRISIDPSEIARGAGQWQAYADGLNPANVPSLARAWRLKMEPPQSYSIDGFRQMLETKGPLWVGAVVPGLHAIVATGVYGDGTPDGTYVRINDPWGRAPGSPGKPGAYNPTPGQGSQYALTFRQFAQEYEGAANLPNVNIQILHSGGTGGRSPVAVGQSYSLGETTRDRKQPPTKRRAPPPAGAKTASALADMLQPGDVVKVGGKTYVIYADAVQSGGVWAWVNRNPGNITKSKEAEKYGAFPGKGNGGFAIFPDETTGFSAIISFLEARKEKTIAQMMAVYAPPDDGKNPMLKGNDPVAYARAIAKRLGVSVETKVTDLSDEQLSVFASEIQRIETGPKGEGKVYAYDDPALPQEIRDRLPAPPAQGDTDTTPAREQAAPAALIPIASAIVGAVMTRVLNNEGDIKWELDQMRGLKHVGDNPANAGDAVFQTVTTPVAGMWLENLVGDRISADFEIRWQYNGHSLGNVEITNTKTNDAVGWGLQVKANIMDDAAAYTKPPSTDKFAAIRVRFYYRFTRTIGSDNIAIQDFTLYGDGTNAMSSRWTQE
jgi:N-acetyl-anhydromuramyl-L-alanine amidase AmpD